MPNSNDQIIGTMVGCLACKAVVWAYDEDMGDVRGICNTFGLPCPNCGRSDKGYDGYRARADMIDGKTICDGWMAMRALAKQAGWEWKPHPYNQWPIPRLTAFDALLEACKAGREYLDAQIEAGGQFVNVGRTRRDIVLVLNHALAAAEEAQQ